MAEPLKIFEPLFNHNRGAWVEGDILSVVSHNEYVVRTFDFALVDGFLDCSRSYPANASYAERFQTVMFHQHDNPSVLLPFDVKGSYGSHAESQKFKTFDGQRDRVAFWICMASADGDWVDVIPNIHQRPRSLEQPLVRADKRREICINRTTRSRLPPKAYGHLDPNGARYRMPLGLLSEALTRMRRVVTDGEVYVNPWNGVDFPDFRPATTQSTRWMHPSETSSQFEGYKQTLEIMRCVAQTPSLTFDFVDHQPRLGDFKLSGKIVELKNDTVGHAEGFSFSRVPVHRDNDNKRTFYFNTVARFEFFIYVFECTGESHRRSVMFFIPEREIPDHFYISEDETQDFEQFGRFKHEMDGEMEWLKGIANTIQQYPSPRRPGVRPVRLSDMIRLRRALEEDAEVTGGHSSARGTQVSPLRRIHGSSEWEEIKTRCHCRFFEDIMGECARLSFGLLIIFPRDHYLCEFGFLRYNWSPSEQEEWWKTRTPPKVVFSLPGGTSVVPISYHARHQECWHHGPTVTAAHFGRLNHSPLRRLLLWDIAGPDSAECPLAPAIIPSDDLEPTKKQRDRFASAAAKRDDNEDWAEGKTPHATGLLHSGLFAAEYAPSRGPLAYSSNPWRDVLAVLESFTSRQAFHYPDGVERQPKHYRYPLRVLLKTLG